MERKNTIEYLRKLRDHIDNLSYGLDDKDPINYTAVYCERHANKLKASYTPEEVQDLIEPIIDGMKEIINSLDLTIDEKLDIQ